MRIAKNNTPKLIRLYAAITLLCYLFSPWGAQQAAGLPAVASIPTPSEILWNELNVPPELGEIEDRHVLSANGAGVVIIQDAHSNADAQKSIQKLIEYFQAQYRIRCIGLEGASAKLDTQMFRSFPSPKILAAVFDDYREKGELAGGPAAAIFSSQNGSYYGIEDWDLYQQGIRRYQAAMAIKSTVWRQITNLKKLLFKKKKSVYSKELLNLDQLLNKFYDNHSDFAVTLKQLATIKPPHPKSALAALITAQDQFTIGSTPAVNTATLSAEVSLLAEKIQSQLEGNSMTQGIREDLKTFNQKNQAFRTSQIEPQAFALYLRDIAMRYSINVRISNGLSKSIYRQQKIENIKGTKVFNDFENYANEVKVTLFRNSKERELDELSDRLRLMEGLAKLELNSEQWRRIKRQRNSPVAWMRNGVYLGDMIVAKKEMEMLEMLTPHFHFYETANSRDEFFLKNIQKIMALEKTDKIVLVAGGFHATAMNRLLQRAGISSVLIMPSIQKITNNSVYQKQMRGDVSWKRYLREEGGKINLYNAFIRAARDRLISASVEEAGVEAERAGAKSQILKSWRDQLIRDLATQGRIEQSAQYTRFIDESLQIKPSLSMDSPKRLIQRAIVFANGLRELKWEGQLTKENIRRLLNPSLTIPIFEVSPFQRDLFVARDLVSTANVQHRSEVRSVVKLKFGEEIILELGVIKTKDNKFQIKIENSSKTRHWLFEGIPAYIQFNYYKFPAQNANSVEYAPGEQLVIKGVEFQQIGNKVKIKNMRAEPLELEYSGNIGTPQPIYPKSTADSFPAMKDNNVGYEIHGGFSMQVKIKGDPQNGIWLISGDTTKLSAVYLDGNHLDASMMFSQPQLLNKLNDVNGLTVWSNGSELILSPKDPNVELVIDFLDLNNLIAKPSPNEPIGISDNKVYQYEITGPYQVVIDNASVTHGEFWELSGDGDHLNVGYHENANFAYLGPESFGLNQKHVIGELTVWSDGKNLFFKHNKPGIQLKVHNEANLKVQQSPAFWPAKNLTPTPQNKHQEGAKESVYAPISLSGITVQIKIIGNEITFYFTDPLGYKQIKFNLDKIKEFLIGRHPSSTVVVDAEHVSRKHALIKVSGSIGNYFITVEDLNSYNGTYVGGIPVAPGPAGVSVPKLTEVVIAVKPQMSSEPKDEKPIENQSPWSALKGATNTLNTDTHLNLEYFPKYNRASPVTTTLKHTVQTLPKVDARVPDAIDQFDNFEDINYELLNMLMKEGITLNDYSALMDRLESMLGQYLRLYEDSAALHPGKFEFIAEARVVFDSLKRRVQKTLDALPAGNKPVKPLDILPPEVVTELRRMNDKLTLEIISIQPGKSYPQHLLDRIGFHELINILHQKGVRNLLNLMESMGVEKRELHVEQKATALKSTHTSTMRYIDGRRQTTSVAPLPMQHVALAFSKGQMVHEHYRRFNPDGATVFADDEKAGVRMKLGVHSARIQYAYAPLQERGRIVVNYQDSYENHMGSNNRLSIVAGVLETLGFKVVRHGIRLDAYYDKDSAADFRMSEMPDKLTLVVQLLSMIKDWDLQLNRIDMGQATVEKLIERIVADGWVGQDPAERLQPKLSKLIQDQVRSAASEIGAPLEANAAVGQRDLDRIAALADRLMARGALNLTPSGHFEKVPSYLTAEQVAPGEVFLHLLENADENRIRKMREFAVVARAAQSFSEPKVIGEIRGFQIVRLRFDLSGDLITLYAMREADSGIFRLGYAVLGDFFYDHPRMDLFRGKILQNNLLSIRDIEEIFAPHHLDRGREFAQWQAELGRSQISPQKSIFETMRSEQNFLEQAVLPFSTDELKWGASSGIISTTSVGGSTVTQGKVIARVRQNRPGVPAGSFRRQVFLAESADVTDNERMKQAAAIVVTTGSPQSHAAIQAREWNIPALIVRGAEMSDAGLTFQAARGKPKRKVVAFEDANMSIVQLSTGSESGESSSFGKRMTDITDGDIVYVDATSGMLYLLAKAGDRDADNILKNYEAWKDSEKGGGADEKLNVLSETVLSQIKNMSLFRAILDELLYTDMVSPDQLGELLQPLLGDVEKKEVVQTFFERRLRMAYGEFLNKYKALFHLPINDKEDIRAIYLYIDGLNKLRTIANSLSNLVPGNVSLTQENMEQMWVKALDQARLHQDVFVKRTLSQAQTKMKAISLDRWQSRIQLEPPSDQLTSDLSNDLGSVKRIADNLRLSGLTAQPSAGGTVKKFLELEAGLQNLRDSQVTQVLGDRYVITKEELLDQHTYRIAGRKSSNSAQLTRGLGILTEMFSVKVSNPQGFAVSTKAYREWRKQEDPEKLDPKMQTELRQAYYRLVDRQREGILKSLEQDQKTQQKIKDYLNSILNVNSEDINDAMIRVWHQTFITLINLRAGDFSAELQDNLKVFASVAVRSSGVDEDSPDAAHAGQKETKLNVVGSVNLFQAIRAVWSSGAEGILIDEMTNPQKGVLAFSMDATNSEPHIRISAAYGQTQGLVDASKGVPNPDEYAVGRNGGTGYPILRQVIGNKTKAVILDLENGGTRHADLSELFPDDPTKAKRPVLENEQVQLVARVVDMLSKYLGYPVDMEAAFRGNELLIYQVRPITTIRDAVERGQKLVSAIRSEVRVKRPDETEVEEALEFIYDKIPIQDAEFIDDRIRLSAMGQRATDTNIPGGIPEGLEFTTVRFDHETMDFLDQLRDKLTRYYNNKRGIRTVLEKAFWTLSRLFIVDSIGMNETDAASGNRVFFQPGVAEALEFNEDDYSRSHDMADQINQLWSENVLLALMKPDTFGRDAVDEAFSHRESFKQMIDEIQWTHVFFKESFPYTLRVLNESYPAFWQELRERFASDPLAFVTDLPRLSSEEFEYQVAEKTLEKILEIGLRESDVAKMLHRAGPDAIYMYNVYSRDFKDDNDRLIQGVLRRSFIQILRAYPASLWTWAGSDNVAYAHTERQIDKAVARIFFLFRQLAAFREAGATKVTVVEMITTLKALNRIIVKAQSAGADAFIEKSLVTPSDLRPGILFNPIDTAGGSNRTISLISSVEADGDSFYVIKLPASSFEIPVTEWKNHLQNSKVTVEKIKKQDFKQLITWGGKAYILANTDQSNALSSALETFSRSEVRAAQGIDQPTADDKEPYPVRDEQSAATLTVTAKELAAGFVNVNMGKLTGEEFATKVTSAIQDISDSSLENLLNQFIENIRFDFETKVSALSDFKARELKETYLAVNEAMKAITEAVKAYHSDLGARVVVAMTKSDVPDIRIYGDAVKALSGMIEAVSVQGLEGNDLNEMLRMLRQSGMRNSQAINNIGSVSDGGQPFVPALFSGASQRSFSTKAILPLGIASTQNTSGNVEDEDLQMIQKRFAVFLLFATAPAALASLSAEDVRQYNELMLRGGELSEREMAALNRIKGKLLVEIAKILSIQGGAGSIHVQDLFLNGLDLNMTVVNEIIQSYRTAAVVAQAA